MGIFFAPNVGIIKMYGGWLEGEILHADIVATVEDYLFPVEPVLYQNFPNPFNPFTKIRFDIPHTSHTSLKIYDILGREIATLVNELKYPGSYTIIINSSTMASGVYTFRLKVGEQSFSRKLIILK